LTEFSILKKAPITEALIDIRVETPHDFKVEELKLLYPSIREQYPHEKEFRRYQSQVNFKNEEVVSSNPSYEHLGYVYTSSDKKQIVKVLLDGFSFSRLYPYETWADLHREAFRLWKLYEEVVSPKRITRVALRYINNFKIPSPIEDFNDYLVAAPIVPEKLPQAVNSYLTRIVIPDDSIGASAIVTQAFEGCLLPNSNSVSIILDIDVIKQLPDGITCDKVWDDIEKLRIFKNEIFFENTTEKLREFYL